VILVRPPSVVFTTLVSWDLVQATDRVLPVQLTDRVEELILHGLLGVPRRVGEQRAVELHVQEDRGGARVRLAVLVLHDLALEGVVLGGAGGQGAGDEGGGAEDGQGREALHVADLEQWQCQP
jgi:hypothetical protein